METVTYADLNIGDIIELDGQQFVWLNSYIMIGVDNNGDLNHFPAGLIRPECKDQFNVLRIRRYNDN